MMRVVVAFACLMPLSAHGAHELDSKDISRGEALYAEQCASCHGADLEGQPNWRMPDDKGVLPAPPHDASGHTWHHDTQMLFDYTKLGGEKALAMRGVTGVNSGMPGFSGQISDAAIWDILAFIQSTWPERIQQIQRGRNPPH